VTKVLAGPDRSDKKGFIEMRSTWHGRRQEFGKGRNEPTHQQVR